MRRPLPSMMNRMMLLPTKFVLFVRMMSLPTKFVLFVGVCPILIILILSPMHRPRKLFTLP